MSILLDALKKSEEQRQLGKTPDIHDTADHDPAGGIKSPGMWLPLSMMAVAAVAITWFSWQQYREPEPAVVSGSPDVVVTEPAVKPVIQQPAPDSRTPVESFTSGSEEADERSDETTADDSVQDREELARSISQYREPAQVQTESPDSGITGTESPDTRPATPVSQPASSAPTPVQPHVTAPVSYWELPQNVRDNLPEFRISVMVYAERPENRFLLINGQRMMEKDTMQGVELEEIRRNGAVFRYRNYRFLVKG